MQLTELSESILRKKIRELIETTLNEISTTGGIAGYLTPSAFTGDQHGTHDQIKKMAKSIGYTLTKRGKEDTRAGDTLYEETSNRYNTVKTNIHTLTENYYKYRNDPSYQPHQKIGKAISEINNQLKLVERVLTMNARLKVESGTTSDKLWKRTTKQIARLEQKFLELSGKLREMRS